MPTPTRAVTIASSTAIATGTFTRLAAPAAQKDAGQKKALYGPWTNSTQAVSGQNQNQPQQGHVTHRPTYSNRQASGTKQKYSHGHEKQTKGHNPQAVSTMGVTCFLNSGWQDARLYNEKPYSIAFFPSLSYADRIWSKSFNFFLLMQVFPSQLWLLTSKPYSSRSPKSNPNFLASSNNKSTSNYDVDISMFCT